MPAEPSPAQITPITNPSDFPTVFDTLTATFAHQTNDAIWKATNPRWSTPSGRAEGIQRWVTRWEARTNDAEGRPNTLFLKASVDGALAGFAVWQAASFVPGHGDAPTDDVDVETLHPGDETEQRFARQIYASLVKRRIAYVREKEREVPPAVFLLDICAVDPAFQRRGIAGELVRFGLEEARRRGLEATTEASSMGRGVYERLGFWTEGEVHYDLDDEFSGRERPSNVFMRTGRHT